MLDLGYQLQLSMSSKNTLSGGVRLVHPGDHALDV